MNNLIGFRSWKIDEDGTLRALTEPHTPWDAPVSTACCRLDAAKRTDGHDPVLAPHPNCSCGLYAYHVPGRRPERDRVSGVVQLWGNVDIHRSGVRAQYARPVLLAVTESAGGEIDPRVRRAADRYGAQLIAADALPDAASEWGRVVAVADRPVQLIGLLHDAAAALRRYQRGHHSGGDPDLADLMAARLTQTLSRTRGGQDLAGDEQALRRLLWHCLVAVGAIDPVDLAERRCVAAMPLSDVAEQLLAHTTLADLGAEDLPGREGPIGPVIPIGVEDLIAMTRQAVSVGNDELVEELWNLRHPLGLASQPRMARELVDAGVTAPSVISAALRAPFKTDGHESWRRRAAERLLPGLTDPHLIGVCVALIGSPVDPALIEHALRHGDFLWRDDPYQLLTAAGDHADALARRLADDQTLDLPTRTLCLSFLNDQAGARALIAGRRTLLLDRSALVELAGEEHCARVARAWLREPDVAPAVRLRLCSAVLGADEFAEELRAQLHSGRVDPSAWPADGLTLLSSLLNAPLAVRESLLRRPEIPAGLAVSLLSVHPTAQPALALSLWEHADLRADQALVALESIGPGGPDIARTYLRVHAGRPLGTQRSARLAAVLVFLGPTDADAPVEAAARVRDHGAPVPLRIACLLALGRGAASHAGDLLRGAPPLPEEFREVCEQAVSRGLLIRRREGALFGGPGCL